MSVDLQVGDVESCDAENAFSSGEKIYGYGTACACDISSGGGGQLAECLTPGV